MLSVVETFGSNTLNATQQRPSGENAGIGKPRARSHQVVDSVLMTDVVQHADIRMIEIRDGLSFLLEALFAYGIRGKLCGQNLDCCGAF